MAVENDASRVGNMERGRPSFQFLLNARDPTPGHFYLRLWRKCRRNLGDGNNGIYQRVKHFDGNLWDDFPVIRDTYWDD